MKRYHSFLLFLGTVAASIITLSISHALAFTGPTNSPGVGSGRISSNSALNIGFGTSTPQSAVKVLVVASSSSSGDFSLRLLQPAQSPLFIVQNNGAVAIGSATSAQKLSVTSGEVWVLGVGQVSNPKIILGDSSSTFGFLKWNSTGHYLMFGTDINALRVQGNNVSIGSSTPTMPLTVATGTTVLFSVDGVGNVGVGTANPAAKLDLNGSLAIQGNEGTAGQFLKSSGTAAAPVWGSGPAGVPSGYSILGTTTTAPSGYTFIGSIGGLCCWTKKANLRTIEYNNMASAANGIIFTWGNDSYNCLYQYPIGQDFPQSIDKYDPVTDTFSALSLITGSSKRCAGATIGLGSRSYYFGGYNYDCSTSNPPCTPGTFRVLANVDWWTTSSGCIETAMPTARYYAAAAAGSNSKIYVIGGEDVNGTSLSTNQEFTPGAGCGGSWTTKTASPALRQGAGAAVINNLIYVAGGYRTTTNNQKDVCNIANSTEGTTTVLAYDTSGGTWSTKTNLPYCLKSGSMGVVTINGQDRAVLFGGLAATSSDNNLPTSTIFFYTTSTNAWTRLVSSSLPYRGYGVNSTVPIVSNTAYLMGQYNCVENSSVCTQISNYAWNSTYYVFQAN